MQNEILVSVIMPTYNRESFIVEAVNSIIHQTHKNWELIIIDDNSSDNTEKIIKQIKLTESRIIYHKLNNNMGASHARNIGMDIARGDFITFLDSDDEYLPDKIQRQLRLFLINKNNNLGIVSCGAIDYRDGKEYNRRLPKYKENYYKSLLSKEKHIGAGTPFLMIKSEVFTKEKILFDPKMPAMQDWDFVLRVVNKFNFAFVKEYLVIVNHHNNERVYNSSNAQRALLIQYDKYRDWLINEPSSQVKFIKNAASLIAHHDSNKKSLKFLSSSISDINKFHFRVEILFFGLLIRLFKFKIIKLFYLKFYK